MGNNVNELEVATVGPHNLIPTYLSLQLHYSWPELEIGTWQDWSTAIECFCLRTAFGDSNMLTWGILVMCQVYSYHDGHEGSGKTNQHRKKELCD
jgi:hypothetical protein